MGSRRLSNVYLNQPSSSSMRENQSNENVPQSSSAANTNNQSTVPSSSSSTSGHSRKRIALNGISTTFEEMSIDFLCPICFDLIKEAHITKCGHTFCYQCIIKSIDTLHRCPNCGTILATHDTIFPNYLLNELILKYRNKLKLNSKKSNDLDDLRKLISSETKNLTLSDVNLMLEILQQRKQLLETESFVSQNKMLLEFLLNLLKKKENDQQQINREIHLIKNDLGEVERILKDVQSKCPRVEEIENSIQTDQNESVISVKREIIDLIDTIECNVNNDVEVPIENRSAIGDNDEEAGFNICPTDVTHIMYQNRKRRIHAYFDDFVKCYFDSRNDDLYINLIEDQPMDNNVMRLPNTEKGLDVFRESLIKFSRYTSLRPLATLNYASDIQNSSTIVSSIEFDKDNEFFAIAGVTKRIKVFDYSEVIHDAVDIHYPCVEMVSDSKISCVIWNSYHKNVLASSDYEGAVTIWDAETGKKTKLFQEHDKRCWSVDFNYVDTRLIASGSDDTKVKLWALNVDRSLATLEVKANVCCVKFNPKSSCHVAFGSADHCVHYYDLRNTKEPLCLFKGHKKAVSYVKFLNKNEIISASTDSQLKLWDIGSPPHSLRSFEGHINEKNFVGLATDGDYITCGSEDNSLYVYYKRLPQPLFSIKFDGQYDVERNGVTTSADLNEFVSAVCFRDNSNVIVAANSRGVIKILELY